MKGFTASAPFRSILPKYFINYDAGCSSAEARKDTTLWRRTFLRRCEPLMHVQPHREIYAGGRLKSEHVWTAVIVLSSVSSFSGLRHCRYCLSPGILARVEIRKESRATRKAFFMISTKKRFEQRIKRHIISCKFFYNEWIHVRSLTLFFYTAVILLLS